MASIPAGSITRLATGIKGCLVPGISVDWQFASVTGCIDVRCSPLCFNGPLFTKRPLLRRSHPAHHDPAKVNFGTVPKRQLRLSASISEQLSPLGEAKGIVTHFERIDLWTELEGAIKDINSAVLSSRERLQTVMRYATQLPRLPAAARAPGNRVPGCTAQVWLTVELQESGKVLFGADSDSEVVRGICAVLVNLLSGATYEQLLLASEDEIGAILEDAPKSTTWYTIVTSMQKRIRALLKDREPQKNSSDLFPSLLITADDVQAQGTFAEAQVAYLTPDISKVMELVQALKGKNIGVVAHFYMDPEVQGVLVAAKKHWPHIHISDSLVMAEHAVKMADAGCKHVAVLGVDFMSENVRAILDKNGHHQVRVYRMSKDDIGCSLAEAAQSAGYLEYLHAAAKTPKSLHVIYINTSLETKAQAQALVPTITCTSSNVLQTILQAFFQVPGLTVWYGPDSYMGANLAELLVQLMSMTDEEIAKIHPAHNRKSIAEVLGHLQYYRDGTCVVHDLFGKDVVDKLRDNYADCFQTAHLEVPGDMFSLAMDARSQGRGVVGSTQNILDFIMLKVREALNAGGDLSPRFVLGTESGMITSIVESVQKLLLQDKLEKGANYGNTRVEIIFPVSSDAITTLPQESSSPVHISGLKIAPGVSSGEGCSVNGGCASCVYMKMNRLDRLLKVCRLVGTAGESLLSAHEPRILDRFIAEQSISDLGCEPILNMRHFQQTKTMSENLVESIGKHGYAALSN